MKTITRYYRVDRREIAFFKYILEAYDGLALLRTIDAAKGIIQLHIAPGCEEPVDRIVQDLKKEVVVQRLANISSGFG